MSKINAVAQLKIMFGIVLFLIAYSAKANASPANCPTEFYQLPLPASANYCQIFDQELPATLTYFVNTSPSEARNFYINTLGEPDKEFTEKGREVMLYKAGMQTIIISTDKQGSQIDILVQQ